MSVGGWSEPPRRRKLWQVSVFPLARRPNGQALQKVKTRLSFTEIQMTDSEFKEGEEVSHDDFLGKYIHF